MIGRGGVFAELRSLMLASIPEGAFARYGTEKTVGDWVGTGTYSVPTCTEAGVTIVTNHVEFASIVLVEIENLQNHCLEHIQELACACSDIRRRSDAWIAVTAYYVGFFAAAVLVRLMGKPIAFITRESLDVLKKLAAAGRKANQGAFEISIGSALSVTQQQVLMQRTDKIHEATWKSALGILDRTRRDPGVIQAADEADFYDSICTTAFCRVGLGFDWPSAVRNQANYRPGCAYKLGRDTIDAQRTLRRWRDVQTNDIFPVVRDFHRRCLASPSELPSKVGMMITVSLSLFILVRALYRELMDRRRLDSRWEQNRDRYRDQMDVADRKFVDSVAIFTR